MLHVAFCCIRHGFRQHAAAPAPLFRIRLQATAELKQSLEHSNKAIENVTKASAEAVAKAEAKAAAVRQPTFMSCFALQPPLNT